jgi:hypothetical protein
MNDGCLLCELEGVLVDRSMELRNSLRSMNPNPKVDPRYQYLYDRLIYVDTGIRMLRREREDA